MATTVHFITTSKIKLEAFNTSKWWSITKLRMESECGSVDTDTPQPIGYEGGLAMARQRIARYKMMVAENPQKLRSNAKICGQSLGDIYLVVECYLDCVSNDTGSKVWVDRALAVCEWSDTELITVSPELINIPQNFIQEYYFNNVGPKGQHGYQTTFGEIINRAAREIPKDDWYHHLGYYENCRKNVRRIQHIRNLLNQISLGKLLKSHSPVYQDFPKPGVRFLDVISLLADATTKRMLIELINDKLSPNHVKPAPFSHVVGLDARGFLLGIIVADLYNIPFIPIHKAGKLPPSPALQRFEFQTEYSTDAFEMAHQPGIRETSRVLVVDDILATGGIIRAALQLLEKYQLKKPPKILVAEDVLGLEHPDAIKNNLVVLFKD
jgi:adenine phosphoribosyltransferase